MRLRGPLSIFTVSLSLMGLLVGCSKEEVAMPAPQITRFILDLSGSNKTMDQYDRLKPIIYDEFSSVALGDPYNQNPKGPTELSITFIRANASQAKVVEIASAQFGQLLYGDLSKVYERSGPQKKLDWPLVQAAFRDSINGGFSNISNCTNSVWQRLSASFGEKNSKDIASKICLFTLNAIETIERKVPSIVEPGGGSDVFGSLREIESWSKKVKQTEPASTVKVVIASDMVHNTNGIRDLFGKGGQITGKVGRDEICEVASQQAKLSSLELSEVSFNVIGRGNSSRVSADEAEALAIFWNCFAQETGFEINFETDGNG